MKRALWLVWVGLIAACPLAAQEPKPRNTLIGHTGSVESVAWSPDGKTLASGSYDETIRLWDVRTGKNTATLKSDDIDRELSYVLCVAYSPDGKTLASGGWDNTVRLWDVASGKNNATFKGHSESVESLAWNPNGEILASISDGAITLWDTRTGKIVATLKGRDEWINSVAWSRDGKTLASGNAMGVITLWNVARRKPVASLDADTGANVLALAYSPDGKILASGDGCLVKLWDVAGGKNVATLDGHSADLVTYVSGPFAGQYVPAVTSVAFSPDGKALASGSQDKTVMLWDVARGKRIATLKGHSGAVRCVAWTADGKMLASASDDKTTRLWDVAAIHNPP